VALGNMYERYHADYIEKLPKGMHSCKGVGKTEPGSHFCVPMSTSKSGLPDFIGAIYQNQKNLRSVHEEYQMTLRFSKNFQFSRRTGFTLGPFSSKSWPRKLNFYQSM
jgi:hypothetical protein